MTLTLRVIPVCVAACLYGELCQGRQYRKSGRDAWSYWRKVVESNPGDLDIDSATAQEKLRADLDELGAEAFVATWDDLVRLMQSAGVEPLFALLHERFAPLVRQGLANQAQPRGQA